ncbi:response regulator [Leucothrix pacifica]|uniref:Response regulatory domain-containing protein n=1 Tax=Leucothrix pacifica TaxID=1247513 RepID=A0A317CFW8_9GAMM|nr:response regulator [Leucothrix pacifica]PWQ97021.1 hypothetical protein DKW60_11405 [Leucothrix pacifica]
MKCILADDNRVNQIVGSQILKNLGHTVTVASNGQEVAEEAAVKRYDIIFMDCQMPVMNGFEATKAIRNLPREHANFNIPIIALTGHESLFNFTECILCGMNSRLSKPLILDELTELLNKLSPQIQQRRQKYAQTQGLSESVMS